jgi:hypothetical protein
VEVDLATGRLQGHRVYRCLLRQDKGGPPTVEVSLGQGGEAAGTIARVEIERGKLVVKEGPAGRGILFDVEGKFQSRIGAMAQDLLSALHQATR